MSDVVPAGILSLPLSRLRSMLAACPNWQNWLGVNNASDALDYISLLDRQDDRGTFAIIDLPDEFESQMLAGGTQNFLYDSGNLMLIIQSAVSQDYSGLDSNSELNAALEFANKLGAMISDLKDLAGTGDYLNIDRIRLVRPGMQRVDRKHRASKGDFYNAALVVGYR